MKIAIVLYMDFTLFLLNSEQGISIILSENVPARKYMTVSIHPAPFWAVFCNWFSSRRVVQSLPWKRPLTRK